MKFPYGLCDFHRIIREGYFYIDRTEKIRQIEAAGETLLFLRPRRFGKSLLLSMLQNYYDVARGWEFDDLFGHLAIGRNPTPLHNRYFILKWDFSCVDPYGNVAEIKRSLFNHIHTRIRSFLSDYGEQLPHAVPLNRDDPLESFDALLAVIRQTPYRLYLLIDEYDNFANEVMMGAYGNRETY
ncbi:MAG: AAA family ATPase, partial [Deltaproteobacteria bacterium]